MNKLKIAGVLLAVLIAAGVGYKLAPSPVTETKTVYVDRVQVIEKIVTKDVIKTVTKPDGTKIVTETKIVKEEVTKEVDKTVTVGSTSPAMSKYSLLLGVRINPFNPLKREYEVELGRRLWESPIYGTISVNSNKTVYLGLKLVF